MAAKANILNDMKEIKEEKQRVLTEKLRIRDKKGLIRNVSKELAMRGFALPMRRPGVQEEGDG